MRRQAAHRHTKMHNLEWPCPSEVILMEINPEYSLEGTDAEAETSILFPPDAKSHYSSLENSPFLGKLKAKGEAGGRI